MQYVGRFVSSVYNTITPNINPATLSGAIDVIVVERQVEVDVDSDEENDTAQTPGAVHSTVASHRNSRAGTPTSPSIAASSCPPISSSSSVACSLYSLGAHKQPRSKRKKIVTEMASTPFHVRFGKMSVLRPAERKVTLHLNSSPDPLPFAMKVGEAGEAFFVFEADPETAPPDLVTSPVLSATMSPISGPAQANGDEAFTPIPLERSSTADVEALDLGEPVVRMDGIATGCGAVADSASPGAMADSDSGACASEEMNHADTVITPEDTGSEAGTARSPSPTLSQPNQGAAPPQEPTREQLSSNKRPLPEQQGVPGDLPLTSDSGPTGSGPHAGSGSALESVGGATSRAGGALRSIGISAADNLNDGNDGDSKGDAAPTASELDGGHGRGEGTSNEPSESKENLQQDDEQHPPLHRHADVHRETELGKLEREMRDHAEKLIKAEMEATRLEQHLSEQAVDALALGGAATREGADAEAFGDKSDDAYPAPFGEGTTHNLRPSAKFSITTSSTGASTTQASSLSLPLLTPADSSASNATTLPATYPVAQSAKSFLDGLADESMSRGLKDISAAKQAVISSIRADLEAKKKRYEALKANSESRETTTSASIGTLDVKNQDGGDKDKLQKLPAGLAKENVAYMFDMDGYKMTADGEDLAFAEGQRLANELPLSRRHGGKGRHGHSERLDKPHRHPRYLSGSSVAAAAATSIVDDINAMPKKGSHDSLSSRRSGSSNGSGGIDDDVLSTDSEGAGGIGLGVVGDISVDPSARQFSRDLVRLARWNEGKAASMSTNADGRLRPSDDDELTEIAITSDEDRLPEGVPSRRRASSRNTERPRSYSRARASATRASRGRIGHGQEASVSDSETQYKAGAPRARTSSSVQRAATNKLPAQTLPGDSQSASSAMGASAEAAALEDGGRAQSPEYDWAWGEMPTRREATSDGLQKPIRATSMETSMPDAALVEGTGILSHEDSDPYAFTLLVSTTVYHFQLSLCWHEGFGEDQDADEYNFEENRVSYGRFLEDADLVNDVRLVVKYNGTLLTWENASTVMATLSLYRQSLPAKPDGAEAPGEIDGAVAQSSRWRRWWNRGSTPMLQTPQGDADGTFAKPPTGSSLGRSSTDTALVLGQDVRNAEPREDSGKPAPAAGGPAHTNKVYAKTLRLTSDQLKSLNLKKGANTITFSVTSSYSGVATCTARVFLWEASHQIVVSDIDGTITKSDALGHVFTMIGRDWTHQGVAKLYTDIARNGYRIMYLTSRAIGQADTTRDYLRGIKQDNYQLPDGPVIMSPDRLIASLHREVILRKPEVFKMACLRDIARLFGCDPRISQTPKEESKLAAAANHAVLAVPSKVDLPAGGPGTAGNGGPSSMTVPTPFYAGFGNRITDALSYRSVNIPSSRIFTIDTNGEVKMELLEMAGYKSSYIHMTDLVDQMFPPITVKEELHPRQREYNDFNYWRPLLDEVELPPDEELLPSNPVSPALSARSGRSIRSVRSNGSIRSTSVRSDLSGESMNTSTNSNQQSGGRLSRFGLPSLGLGRRSSGNNIAAASADKDKAALRAFSEVQRAPTFANEAPSGTSPPSSYGSGVTSWAASWRRRAASPGASSQASVQATSPLVGPVITAVPESEDEDDYAGSDDDVSSLEGDGMHEERQLSEDEGGSYEEENIGDDVLDDDLLAQGEIRFEWRG
ncbi:LNS2-domain-containing protein [Tilletiaria anomala UBC 951]|uniref:phosphatidate phosphatase n=1 Tax=Tilletiaria anomala (strain ATCC 24038 / CBS 436.72 / UBC 951) TaxID=1037660 RepID=A0A066WMX5_TILAU|nr:LNS2-domain-containing protein [Tilletiaria anomala UBC 951]KDN51985.1 LNS2-domain-containing protein [Tilletiaria anomala UBC 951]